MVVAAVAVVLPQAPLPALEALEIQDQQPFLGQLYRLPVEQSRQTEQTSTQIGTATFPRGFFVRGPALVAAAAAQTPLAATALTATVGAPVVAAVGLA